ncbi:MAG: squalene synthase HpnC [Rubrivivax sp.]|nr:squalene synthase HpnC [Rubrivivax sp.]
MGVGHYENFPVASALCPPRLRPAVAAIYHFARTADDIADEGDAAPEERLATLRRYRDALERACDSAPAKTPDARAAVAFTPSPTHDNATGGAWPQVFEPLARQMHAFALPARWLHALLDAFEQDVRNPVYTNRQMLLDYCARSANPVGRLLLHLYGIDDADSLARSDAVCSALQLINFWQDLSIDGPRGRCYVPAADRERHGVPAADLAAAHDSAGARALVRELCGWAEALMRYGAPLALRVPGRAGWELRLVVQGGLRVLEKIGAAGHASLSRRPRLGVADVPVLLWRAAAMSASAAAAAAGLPG